MNSIGHIAISLFIIVYIFWMVFWDVDARNPIKKWGIPIIQPVFSWLGLEHQWKMFAPKPAQSFYWPKIIIYLKNGELITIDSGHPNTRSRLDKILHKKTAKYNQRLAAESLGVLTKTDYAEFLLDDLSLRDTCEKIEIYKIFHRIPNIDAPNREISEQQEKLVFVHFPLKKRKQL